MENIKLNLPPFYVGQKVVYLNSKLPKDSIWTVLGIRKAPCCGIWAIDIGHKHGTGTLLQCAKCNKIYQKDSSVKWWDTSSFAPLEERFISLAEVIEIESQLTGAN